MPLTLTWLFSVFVQRLFLGVGMLSPAELLFGRKINTDLPQTDHCLTPQWTYLDKFRKADKEYKNKQQS